ncbi:MAG: maleylacetoacetate isomerase [Emcibacter sp.]|nr:maleylacetoacetate isomerase [Emcibacter sp.]
MELYGYFRSSAAYRIRAALNVKGLDYTSISVSLIKGDHNSTEFLAKNPQGFVPFLTDGHMAMGQSMAILEYLEETYPTPAFLPSDAAGRARVRQLAGIVASDIHPLNNLRVLKYIKGELEITDDQKSDWYKHWVLKGFTAFEAILQQAETTDFCHGDNITFADLCLVPQVYNARRFNCPLEAYPNILRITENCNRLDAFIKAQPENQADAT